MKLVSFDIGIKNMAYCVMEVGPIGSTLELSSFQVVDWNVIDLIESRDTSSAKNVCGCLLKTKKKGDAQCGKKAKYHKNDQYFCETHAKTQTQYLIPSKENTLGSLRKRKVDDITQLYRQLDLHSGFGSFPNKPEMIESIARYYDARTFSEIRTVKKNANDANLIHIGWAIRRAFETREHFNDITHVVIENQISPIATRMKTIQGMLAQYFIMQSSLENPVEVVFVSSSNKLRLGKNTKPDTVATETPPSGSKYKQNKKDGVELCRQYISANPVLEKWSGVLGLSRKDKKDDLADCFLQVVWYMSNRNIINCADNLKINSV